MNQAGHSSNVDRDGPSKEMQAFKCFCLLDNAALVISLEEHPDVQHDVQVRAISLLILQGIML